jgi:hypothetical protein
MFGLITDAFRQCICEGRDIIENKTFAALSQIILHLNIALVINTSDIVTPSLAGTETPSMNKLHWVEQKGDLNEINANK